MIIVDDKYSLNTILSAFLDHPPIPPCLFLVHPDPARLEDVATYLHAERGWSRFSVGKTLSTALLHSAPEDRPREAVNHFKDSLRALAPGPVLCTGITLLFEPALCLDPLALCRRGARLTPLIVLWPGTYAREVLAYAVPDHAHYRTWRHPEVRVEAIP